MTTCEFCGCSITQCNKDRCGCPLQTTYHPRKTLETMPGIEQVELSNDSRIIALKGRCKPKDFKVTL